MRRVVHFGHNSPGGMSTVINTLDRNPQRMGFENYRNAWPVADWYHKKLGKGNEKTARSF